MQLRTNIGNFYLKTGYPMKNWTVGTIGYFLLHQAIAYRPSSQPFFWRADLKTEETEYSCMGTLPGKRLTVVLLVHD